MLQNVENIFIEKRFKDFKEELASDDEKSDAEEYDSDSYDELSAKEKKKRKLEMIKKKKEL